MGNVIVRPDILVGVWGMSSADLIWFWLLLADMERDHEVV